MKKENSTQGIHNNLRDLTIEKLKEALNDLESLPKLKPDKCIILCQNDFNIIYEHANKPKDLTWLPLAYVRIIVDDDVPANTFFYCEPRLFEIWKSLINHPWIDKSDPEIDLCKVADMLYNQELKEADNPYKITFQFTEGERFPIGATFMPKHLDHLKSEIKIKF